MIRRQGNLRPAGGGRAGSGRRWRGRSRHPCGAPPAAPGGSRHQLLALPGSPARGARLGPPPHPGRDPEAVSRGSRRVPGDTERRREGRRARLCERSPSGGREGHGAPAPLWPGSQSREAARPFKGAKLPERERAQARGARPAPRTGTRDARGPVPGKNNGRAEVRPLLQPTRGFPPGCVCLLDLRPCRRPRPPLAARVWSRTIVGLHGGVGGETASGKSFPATREWVFVVTPRAARPVAPP